MVTIELNHVLPICNTLRENEEVYKSKTTKFFLFYKRRQTYFPILNVQTCDFILGGDLLYACAKFQSEMISLTMKDILKKKNDFH